MLFSTKITNQWRKNCWSMTRALDWKTIIVTNLYFRGAVSTGAMASVNFKKLCFGTHWFREKYRGSSHNAVLPQRGFPSYTDVLVLVRGGVRTFYLINSSNTVFLSRLKNQCYRRTPCTNFRQFSFSGWDNSKFRLRRRTGKSWYYAPSTLDQLKW